MSVAAGSTPRPAAEPTTARDGDRASRPRSSSTGTSVSPRRSTAAPAARTRSRFGLRSPKTTRSTAWVVRASPGPRRRAGHVPAALDRDERRRRDRPEHDRSGAAAATRRPSRAPSPSPTSSARSPGTTPNRSISAMTVRAAMTPGSVGARDQRHALVRARRGDHRSAPGSRGGRRRRWPRPSRRTSPWRSTPVRSSDAGRDVARATRSPSSVSASTRQRPPSSRSDSTRTTRSPRSAAAIGRREPGPAATDDQHVRLEPPRRPPDCRRAWLRPPAAAHARRTSAARRGIACAAPSAAGIDGGRTSAGSSATRGRRATAASRDTFGSACSPRATSPSRTGTRHDRTLGTPSTSHSHQPHWPVEHIRPRARWNRKLRDRIGRPAASRLTASGSPSMPSISRPSNVKVTGDPARRAGQSSRGHVSGCGRSASCRCRRAWTRGTRPGPPSRARDRCRSA